MPLDPRAVPTREELARYVTRGSVILSADTAEERLDELSANVILPLGMQYVSDIKEPVRVTTIDPMSPGWEAVMQRSAINKMKSFEALYSDQRRLPKQLQGMARKYPEIAEKLGINENYWNDMVDQYKSVEREGLGALGFILNNLDRGRGAMMEFALNSSRGASPRDALRRAMDVLKGSDHGFVMSPEKMGPSGADLLRGMGWDDSFVTSAAGFGLDVLVDPINLLGPGVARKGLGKIGAHQILNREGREVLLTKLKRIANENGYAELAHAPFEVGQALEGMAMGEMRNLINSSDEAAEAYLDMGGLKIASMTLFAAPLKNQIYVRAGKTYVSKTSQTISGWFGGEVMKGVDKVGKWGADNALPLGKRLNEFMALLPSNLREVGQNVALILNRTNPLAGEEWKQFKTAQYYDKISLRHQLTFQGLKKIFGQFDVNELEQMTKSIEANTVAQLSQPMQQAVTQYTSILDKSLIEEVQRGIFKQTRGWSAEKTQKFEAWVAGMYAPDETELELFHKIRLEHYVPHIYRDVTKAKAMTPRYVGPRAPTISEGFTERRLVPTLKEAELRGLVPEYNLFVLAAQRLTTADTAIATFDFLKKAGEEFGELSPKYINKMLEASGGIADGIPYLTWQRYMDEQTTRSGLLEGDAARHFQIAREVARQAGVPAKFVAKLDEAAQREFLLHRFRTVNPATAHKIWKKYVEKPTKEGLYRGHLVAPGVDAMSSAARARELADPLYGGWSYITTGGKGDPAVLNRLMLPDTIVRDIERLKARHITPEFQGLLRLYDVPNFWWKFSVTLPFPAFNFRNKLTNILNSSTEAGLGVIKNRGLMRDIMWGKEGHSITEKGLKIPHDRMRKEMMENGILLTDYHRGDVGGSIEEAARMNIGKGKNMNRIPLPGGEGRPGIPSIANPLKAPVVALREAAATLENSDRALVYITSRLKGLSPQDARERVSRVLFDWEDLSGFEKTYLRRLIPFYTWARKNTALQVSTLVNQPARIAAYEKFRSNFSRPDKSDDPLSSHVERELLPRALHDEMGIRLDVAKGVSTWMMNFDTPVSDFDRLWSGSAGGTLKAFFLQNNPVLKGALESAFEQNMFTGKKTLDFGSSDKVYPLMLSAPKPLKEWLDMQQVVSGDNITVRIDADKYRKMMWAFTVFGMSRVWSTLGNATDPNVNLSHRMLTFFTGGKIRRFNPSAELSKRNMEIMGNIDQGGVPRMRRMRNEFIEQRILDKMGRMPDPEEIREAIEIGTPKYGNELDETYDTFKDE